MRAGPATLAVAVAGLCLLSDTVSAQVVQITPDQAALRVRYEKGLWPFASSLGSVEFVTRERYVLLRSRRIFADVVVMTDALRLAIHLSRKVEHGLFIKVAADRKHVTHVAKLHDMEELDAMKPFLREAYEYSVSS
jgi:predicted transport protein